MQDFLQNTQATNSGRTCLTLVYRPWPISRPPEATSTLPSAYTRTLPDIAGGLASNLHVSYLTSILDMRKIGKTGTPVHRPGLAHTA